ncbi:hypothetical protein K1719_013700 [Acacia pycnantha]|nr:hypothetical protein K1719_013700 [Acacia pycnantha]
MQGSFPSNKRKRPDDVPSSSSVSLSDADRLYNVIRSTQDTGIWRQNLKRDTGLPENAVKKAIDSLLAKKLIKEVVNCQNKTKKYYMASEFEPSEEITGGYWHTDGKLDEGFINTLKSVCQKQISLQKIATVDEILDWITKKKILSVEITSHRIEEILRLLVLGDEIIQKTSTGFGDSASVPEGSVYYQYKNKSGTKGETKIHGMASIPCGTCPRVSSCTPDGIISPRTCGYYQKWLDF